MIEVIAIMVLLGILAVTVLSSSCGSKASERTAIDALAASLRYTQARALADGASGGWCLAFSDTQQYAIGPIAALPNLPDQRSLPSDVNLISGITALHFDAWGRPIDPSTGAKQSTVTAFTVSGPTTSFIIRVNPETGWIGNPQEYVPD